MGWWSYGKSLACSVLWWSRGKSLAFSVVWWSLPVVAGGPVVVQAAWWFKLFSGVAGALSFPPGASWVSFQASWALPGVILGLPGFILDLLGLVWNLLGSF